MTLTHDNPADDFGDADWSAFAYVAGELDEAELATWEARLAEGDVEACEAVARAVELVGVVAESGRVDAAVDRCRRIVRRGWLEIRGRGGGRGLPGTGYRPAVADE